MGNFRTALMRRFKRAPIIYGFEQKLLYRPSLELSTFGRSQVLSLMRELMGVVTEEK